MAIRKVASAGLMALGIAAVIVPRVGFAATDMKVLDPDGDGTVSLDEAKAAADKKFTTLDPDKDGKLDAKEAAGTISDPAFKIADEDKDGTVDKKEYMKSVEGGFKVADPDGDGKLDAKELETPAGQTLSKWLQ